MVRIGRWVLIVLAAYAGASLTNKLVTFDPSALAEGSAMSAPSDDPDRQAATLPRDSDPALILSRNLFGAAPIEQLESKHSSGGGKSFDMSLILRGTAFSDGHGFAVFQDPNAGVQEIFAKGEAVFGGAKLASVESDAAVLTLRGRKKRYELELPLEGEESDGSSKRATAPAQGGIRPTGTGTYEVDRREIDFAVENLNYIITQARAVPVLRDGKAIGFKLFNIKDGSLFQRLGLHNGDVVQRINGTSLDNPSKAIGLLDEIQSMEAIQMNFLRGGKPLTHSYSVR
jgi:general secretion pathway protein C